MDEAEATTKPGLETVVEMLKSLQVEVIEGKSKTSAVEESTIVMEAEA